jgi:hypothetical protein
MQQKPVRSMLPWLRLYSFCDMPHTGGARRPFGQRRPFEVTPMHWKGITIGIKTLVKSACFLCCPPLVVPPGVRVVHACNRRAVFQCTHLGKGFSTPRSASSLVERCSCNSPSYSCNNFGSLRRPRQRQRHDLQRHDLRGPSHTPARADRALTRYRRFFPKKPQPPVHSLRFRVLLDFTY